MSERNFCINGGVDGEEKEEKQFNKLVLQSNLIIQDSQPPTSLSPLKFPNSSSGNTFNGVSKTCHL